MPHTVEEAYEVADAALAGDDAKLLDELGDLLFQVYFLALLLRSGARATSRRSRAACTRSSCAATRTCSATSRRRPPGGCARTGSGIKREQEGREGVFHDVPEALPGAAATRARCSSARSRSASSTRTSTGAVADLDDELRELQGRRRVGPSARAEELGDVLFAAVNVARKLDVDPELALRRATDRFRARVETAEELAASSGENWTELPLEQQDRYFDLAKEKPNEPDRRRARAARSSTRAATRRSRWTCCSSRARSAAPRFRPARRPACTRRSSCATAAPLRRQGRRRRRSRT